MGCKVLGQSAIEYLMTYGWMLLVVAIVGGTIFSVVGDQSIENVSGFNSNEIVIDDFGMTNSGLAMNLKSQSAGKVTVKEIIVSNSQGVNATVPLNSQVGLRDTRNLNLPYVTNSESTDVVDIKITYSTDSLSNITTTGTITGKLEFDKSLVGYWTLAETQGNRTHVYDISQNQNHGEINGSDYVETEFKQAMYFDGTGDKIELSGDRGSGQTSDITTSIWAKTSDGGWIFGEGAVFRIYMDPGGDAGFWIREEEFGESNTVSGGSIEADTWYNLVGVYDSDRGEQKLYLNGEEVAVESPEFEGVGDNHDNLCIGESWCGSENFFNGTIANVRIFNRALSERAVEEFYNRPSLIE